jgi:hypothetical protein
MRVEGKNRPVSRRNFQSRTGRQNFSSLVASSPVFPSALIRGVPIAPCEPSIARDTHLESDCICTEDIWLVWMNKDTFWFWFWARIVPGRVWSVFSRVTRAKKRLVDLVWTAKPSKSFWNKKTTPANILSLRRWIGIKVLDDKLSSCQCCSLREWSEFVRFRERRPSYSNGN